MRHSAFGREEAEPASAKPAADTDRTSEAAPARGRPPRKSRPPSSCFDRAVRILALRDHSRAELHRKLTAAGHAPEEIEDALRRLSELGYLDDARFAEEYARQLSESGKVGRMAAVRKLLAAGIDRNTAETAAAQAFDGVDERARAEELIRRRFPQAADGSADVRARARAARFLAGRGFSGSVIAQVLRGIDGAFDA